MYILNGSNVTAPNLSKQLPTIDVRSYSARSFFRLIELASLAGMAAPTHGASPSKALLEAPWAEANLCHENHQLSIFDIKRFS